MSTTITKAFIADLAGEFLDEFVPVHNRRAETWSCGDRQGWSLPMLSVVDDTIVDATEDGIRKVVSAVLDHLIAEAEPVDLADDEAGWHSVAGWLRSFRPEAGQ